MRIEEYTYKKGYRVTQDGDLLNPAKKPVGTIGSVGYIVHNMKVNGKNKKCSAHRLQAYQKYKDKLYEEGMEVRHLNSNRLDNSYTNIVIGSHSENMMDVPEHIRKSKALHATSFTRKHDKEAIKVFHKSNNNSYKATMQKFGISSKGTLHFILNN